ncbi:hypothetical protein BKA62DRAFT_675807 [Auriculariales sp. MPI-PUGE-AT-0066]|nr:hypothetical protein BKA62DRAFT_675807 [Auriculariales sp. MPI-PUGE-AT-0066]
MRFFFAVVLFSCLAMALAVAVDKRADLPATSQSEPPSEQPQPPNKKPDPPSKKPDPKPSKPLLCYPSVARGPLAIYKDKLSGQRVPLTLNGTTLVLQGTGGSKKAQAQLKIVPCTSEFLKKTGQDNSSGRFVVNGHVKTASGLCLARNPKDAAVKAVKCSDKDDKSQENQFWTVTLEEDKDGVKTAKDAPLDLVKKGFFHHLYGGIVHESTTKPPHKWILTFSTTK